VEGLRRLREEVQVRQQPRRLRARENDLGKRLAQSGSFNHDDYIINRIPNKSIFRSDFMESNIIFRILVLIFDNHSLLRF